jgi:valyl-tRNA synthetase
MSNNRYNHQKAEKEVQELWQSEKIYQQLDIKKPIFTIDTPPPTASGSLHVGHVFSYTHTDIIARYKRLKDFAVFYPFGLDDNGLPTERFVEQKNNIQSQNMKRSEFIAYCLQESALMGQQFSTHFQRLGLSADFDNMYSTISQKTQKLSQKSFIELYKKGHLYRKSDPALYCTNCQTTVAQAELDDTEKPSTFYTIIFTTQEGKNIEIATTRPELLPSCVAIVCHPDDHRYADLVGKMVIVPLYRIEVPVLQSDRVDTEKGTGLVMICTFGDKTDIHWFRTLSLAYKPSIDTQGRFLPHTGPLAGLTIFSARKKIVELLEEQRLITNKRDISHAVSLHERCKKEIEFLIVPQWFIAILPHKESLMTIADNITWYPEFMKSRYLDWVKNLSWDWCISRQRTYGIPFPVFHCLSCQQVILPPENTPLPVDPQEQQFVTECPHCHSSDIVPDTDVMDTWNTSSLTPYIAQELFEEKYEKVNQFIPMGMRPQAHDIIRTWAFDTIVKTYFHEHKAPWQDIVISGHVLSKEKRKLSKKEGAALVPEILLEQYSADAIRYWTTSARLGYDVVYSENELKNGTRLITKIWNAFRFLEPHIDKTINFAEKHAPTDLLNRWILNNITHAFQNYTRHFNEYEFGLSLSCVERFFWQDFCDNYLEFIKHRLYNPDKYEAQLIQETKETLTLLGIRLLQLFAPFLPHITETLYQELYKTNNTPLSLHITLFHTYQTECKDSSVQQPMVYLLSAIQEARRLKTEQKLSLKTELQSVIICTKSHEIITFLHTQEQFLKTFLGAHAIEFVTHDQKTKENALSQEQGGWHMAITLD